MIKADGHGGNLYAWRLCWFQAYSNSIAVGTVAAVLGGALTWTGGAIVSIYGMQNQFGAGHTLFTGKKARPESQDGPIHDPSMADLCQPPEALTFQPPGSSFYKLRADGPFHLTGWHRWWCYHRRGASVRDGVRCSEPWWLRLLHHVSIDLAQRC
jgi:hypothetical protein